MRRRVSLAVLLALAVGASRAPGQAGRLEGLLPEDPLAGGKLFVEKGCARCHAVYGQGGRGGPDLGKTKINRGFLELAGVMWNHSPRMEEEFHRLKFIRPTFTEEEMAKIIAFVYFLNYFDSPGDPARGQLLLVEKGCQRCHSVGGIGGQIGKPLDGYRRYASPVFISTAMWNNGPRMAEAMRRLGVPRPTFQAGDVRDILAYVRSAALPQPDESRVFLPPGNPLNGSRLFRDKHCTDCHAISGSEWSAGPDLGRAELRGSLSTIAGFQWNHGPAMWEMMERRGLPVPRFTEREMSDIVTYLYFIQYVEEPGDAVAGRKLFIEKGCNTCHGVTAEASAEGLRVTEMEPFRTPAAVIARMWNHASEMERLTWEKNIVWPTVKGGEMADLIAFLLSSAPAPDPAPAAGR
jgi:mono/diheme cytochrome c family protein